MTPAFLTHLVMVPGDTPKWRAVALTPFLTAMKAASLRTLGRYGFCVYMPRILLSLGVSKLLNHYAGLTQPLFHANIVTIWTLPTKCREKYFFRETRKDKGNVLQEV